MISFRLPTSPSGSPADVVANWLRNKDTVEFLGVWEKLNNVAFNLLEFEEVKNRAGSNRFSMSPSRWIARTGAIGLFVRTGRHGGGTFAHRDLALGFCYWLSPPFQLYLLQEFQRLKADESERNALEWHVERLTDLVDEARNWLDTIPGQKDGRSRLKNLE